MKGIACAKGAVKVIALIGFTGAGKSTLGKLLSRNYGLPCYDNDELVEKMMNMSIREIFSVYGEPRFRELEAESIASRLNTTEHGVLVTGGGAPLAKETRELLAQHALTVHVQVPLAEIIRRLETNDTRPLLQGGNHERITMLYNEREHLYDFAHAVVSGTNLQLAAAQVIAKWMAV